MASAKRIVVAVTGASGAVYARRLLQCLTEANVDVHLIVSSWGKKLFLDELGIATISAATLLGRDCDRLTIHPARAMDSVIASGSFLTNGMIVCPCSSHTLGEIASGLGDTLVSRAAAVTLKEARRLIIVHREMPISRIDLLNMLRLSEAGAIICPASPGFYMMPETIDDLVDFVVGKLLDLVGVPHPLRTRWSGDVKSATGDTQPTP